MELVRLGLWSSSSVFHVLTWFLRAHVLFVAEVVNVRRWAKLVLAGMARQCVQLRRTHPCVLKGRARQSELLGRARQIELWGRTRQYE